MKTNPSVLFGVLASFAFVIAGCGGSSSSPARDGGRDVGGTGGVGLPGAGGAPGGGGMTGGGAGGSGGARVDGGDASSGDTTAGTGGSSGSGGSPGGDAAPGADVAADAPRSDAADAPVTTPDAAVDTGADVIIVIDGGPTVVACPANVSTAACTSGNLCVQATGEVCGCLPSDRWFCPGIVVGSDGGVTVPDAAADAASAPVCAAGTMSGDPCSTVGDFCRIPGSLGCGC
ncbi:MAG TPA: hypothetical protein VGF45_19660, partial [Polyangia bacterium]